MSWLPGNVECLPSLPSLPPATAGDLAFKMFCSPALSDRQAENHAALVKSARHHLRKATWRKISTTAGQVQSYIFEPLHSSRGTVMMVHGWTSEAAFMCALAEQVRRAGFRVVVFDFPAHGLSSGRTTDLLACARAALEIGKAIGPVDTIVAHSFGCVAALLAVEGRSPMRGKLNIEQIVLMASPNKLWEVTRAFADRWNIPAGARRRLEKRLERVGERPMSEFVTAKLLKAVDRDALIIHSRDDAEFPFSCAEEISVTVPHAELNAVDGLGHRSLLFSPPVIRSVVAFIKNGLSHSSVLAAAE